MHYILYLFLRFRQGKNRPYAKKFIKNINEDEKLKDANLLSSKHLTNIVCVLIAIFGLLFTFSLIDFILPIVILITTLVLFDFLINKLIKSLILRYGLK